MTLVLIAPIVVPGSGCLACAVPLMNKVTISRESLVKPVFSCSPPGSFGDGFIVLCVGNLTFFGGSPLKLSRSYPLGDPS